MSRDPVAQVVQLEQRPLTTRVSLKTPVPSRMVVWISL